VKFVLKSVRYSKADYSPKQYSRQRQDGMTLEAMTSSSYVLQIYGFCGLSQFLEVANGGSTHDLIKLSRSTGYHLPPIDKLAISIQLSTAVADLHEIAFVNHRDLCCHQFVFCDGVYKLNDFHLIRYKERHLESNRTCGQSAWEYPKLRSPEEYYATDHDLLLNADKSDTYMLGNVIYYVLTNKWLFEHKSPEETKILLLAGKRSEIPSTFRKSSDAANQAIIKAIKMCWIQRPQNRPSARTISNFLQKAYLQYEHEKSSNSSTSFIASNNVIKVNIPPLPKDFSFSDSEFYQYLYNKF